MATVTDNFQLVLDQHAPVVITDDSGVITEVNELFCRVAGRSSAELIGQNVRLLNSGTHSPEFFEELWAALRAGEVWRGDICNRAHDGTLFWVDATIVPLGDGRYCAIQKVITERKATEAAARQTAAQFQLLHELGEVNRKLDDPEEIMASVARILGEHLEASRCAYADVEEDDDTFTIKHDYTRGCASTVGTYHLELFGPRAVEKMRKGVPLVIRDVDRELKEGEGREMFNAIGIKAIICCAYVNAEGLRAMMAVHQEEPRDWTEQEIELVDEVTERCWSTILRARTQHSLIASQRFAVASLDALTAHIAVIDGEGVIIATNRAWREFAAENGLRTEKAGVGTNYLAVCDRAAESDPVARESAAVIRDLIAGRKNEAAFEYPCHSPEEERWFVCRLTRFQADHGTRVVLAHEDVTPIRKAQKEAERMMKKFADFFEFAPDATLMVDETGGVKLANRSAEKLFCCNREQLVGARVRSLLRASDSEGDTDLEQRVLDCESFLSVQAVAGGVLKSEEEDAIPVELSVSPLQLADGRLKVVAIRDLTERLEQERRERHSQRLESLGTLASGVAHDLNNALTPVLMSCELIRDLYPGETDLVDTIESSARHGANMVGQLLTFARGHEGKRLPIQVENVAKGLGNMILGTFPKNIRFDLNRAAELPAVLGNGTQLHQVLLNLCVNARDAMPEGGRLSLDLSSEVIAEGLATGTGAVPPGRYVVIRVADTGMGVAPEMIDKIFDPFFTTKGPDRGTGLGLSTVMGIIKAHGGFLHVDSTPGVGTCFAVFLPACEKAAGDPVAADTQRTIVGRGQRILVVDDEPSILRMAANVIRRLQLEPLVAPDGPSALEALADETPLDAVVTDYSMPGMNGLELARTLRTRFPDVPIAVSSGRLERQVIDSFAELGVTEVLHKPYSHTDLSELLSRLLKVS